MSQILTKIEGILKDKYQPALSNLINVEPCPFMEMIRKEPLHNNKVRAAAPVGLNGGFGFGAEGLATPTAHEQKYVDFELSAVDMYVDIQVSNKTVALGSSNQSSMINALDTEIKSAYAAAKWNLGRSLFGDGSGILTHGRGLNAQDMYSVDSTAALIEGLAVEVYADMQQNDTYELVAHGCRITRIDHETKTVYLSGNSETLVGTDGFLTVQGSYNREITGLGAIFGENNEIYGVSRTENPFLVPATVSLGGKITDMGLWRGIRTAKKMRGANIDLIMMGDDAFEAYQTYMDEHSTHLVDRHKFVGGATGYSILVGDREVIIVNESMVPANEAWAVDTKSFTLQQTPWEFVAHQGSIFTLQGGTSIYRALLASYGNLLCTNPGGCVKFTDCAPKA